MDWVFTKIFLGGVLGIFVIWLIVRIASAAYFKSKKDFLNYIKQKKEDP